MEIFTLFQKHLTTGGIAISQSLSNPFNVKNLTTFTLACLYVTLTAAFLRSLVWIFFIWAEKHFTFLLLENFWITYLSPYIPYRTILYWKMTVLATFHLKQFLKFNKLLNYFLLVWNKFLENVTIRTFCEYIRSHWLQFNATF